MKFEHTCKQCGKQYFTKYERSNYCSIECKNINNKRIVVPCVGCGKDFKQKITNQKYCSYECYHKYDLRYKEGENHFGKGIVITEERKKNLSASTKQQWKQGVFNDRLKMLRENPLRGVEHYNYKNGSGDIRQKIHSLYEYKDWRKAVFARDNYTCQKCGKHGCYLEVHHKRSFSEILKEHNIKTHLEAVKCAELLDIDNGVTLCVDCHAAIDPYRKRMMKKSVSA